MSRRITVADVSVKRDEVVEGQHVIVAHVQGRQRVFVVDFNTLWTSTGSTPAWWCSCGKAPDCTHIRATREVVGQ